MSIFSRVRGEHLPIFSALAGVLAQDCVLCAAAAGRHLVCAACDAALRREGEACEACALPLPGGGLCGECRLHPFAFDRARAALDYRFPVDRLVHRFKYAGDLAVGAWLARRVAREVAALPRPDLLVAPPLTEARLATRGFNQALELARVAGRERGIPVDPFALAKLRETSPQPGLARGERRANLKDAFRCRRGLRGAHVAIVDDVMTTGATADALARELRRAGARAVSVWVAARTPRPAER